MFGSFYYLDTTFDMNPNYQGEQLYKKRKTKPSHDLYILVSENRAYRDVILNLSPEKIDMFQYLFEPGLSHYYKRKSSEMAAAKARFHLLDNNKHFEPLSKKLILDFIMY